jgi:hypothetical protein
MNRKIKARVKKSITCCIEKIDKGLWVNGTTSKYEYQEGVRVEKMCAIGLISDCTLGESGYPLDLLDIGGVTDEQRVVVSATIEAVYDALPASFRNYWSKYRKQEEEEGLSLGDKQAAIVEYNDGMFDPRKKRWVGERTKPLAVRNAFVRALKATS